MSKSDYADIEALYLEDEILVGMYGEDILLNMGFRQVHVAHSLGVAERILEKGEIGFALLDVNLGDGRTSLEFAKRLQSEGVRIAFATGYNDPELFLNRFGAPTVEKPFSEQSVSRAVSMALSTTPE